MQIQGTKSIFLFYKKLRINPAGSNKNMLIPVFREEHCDISRAESVLLEGERIRDHF